MLYNNTDLDIQIEIVTSCFDEEWDNFVNNSVNGTIFHKLSFLSYHPSEKFRWFHLKFRDAKTHELKAILPGSLDENGKFLSPAGASYGSFVFKKSELSMTEQVLTAFLKFAENNKFREVYITPSPLIYSSELNQNIDFLLQYYGFTIQKHLISNAVWVDQIKEKDFKNIATNMHIRCVRKAKKEQVTVAIEESEESYSENYEILVENKKKFNTPPTHSFEEMLNIQKLFPDNVKLFVSRNSEGNAIGSIWAFETNQNVLLAFYISHYYEYRELRAVNLLYQSLVEYAMENKIAWVDLGVSMDTSSLNPMEPSRSLIYFKECIGTRGFLRTTYKRIFN